MNFFYRKIKDFVSVAIIASLGTIIACSGNVDELIIDPETVRQDSIDQSIIDNAAIDSYITENSVENVITAESGIRYTITKEGNGKTPNFNDIVSVHFVWKFLDGEVFDTSNEQAAIDAGIFIDGRNYVPIRFNFTSNGSGLSSFVPGLSPGFREGLIKILQETDGNNVRLYSKGGEAIVFIPSASAFGTTGTLDGSIAPNTVIAFELTMVSIRP